jgi:hypothetical protein
MDLYFLFIRLGNSAYINKCSTYGYSRSQARRKEEGAVSMFSLRSVPSCENTRTVSVLQHLQLSSYEFNCLRLVLLFACWDICFIIYMKILSNYCLQYCFPGILSSYWCWMMQLPVNLLRHQGRCRHTRACRAQLRLVYRNETPRRSV